MAGGVDLKDAGKWGSALEDNFRNHPRSSSNRGGGGGRSAQVQTYSAEKSKYVQSKTPIWEKRTHTANALHTARKIGHESAAESEGRGSTRSHGPER